MTKRFTDTAKWNKIWFRKLRPVYKCFWEYIRDTCDHAGIWEVDFETAEYFIGEKLDVEDLKKNFCDHYKEIRNGKKWFLPDFIKFQYGRLRNNNSAHISVLRILEEYELSIYAIGDSRELVPSDKISKETRIQIFEESNGICIYCDKDLQQNNFEVDHIIPTIAGGNSKKDNLILCCNECNSFKSDFELDEFIKRRSLDKKKIISKLKALKKGLFSSYIGAKDKDKAKAKDKDKDKAKDKDNIKHKYGEFVLLTRNEYRKLIKKFGGKGAKDRIKNLDLQIGSKGYKFDSHYHTVLAWERKNERDRQGTDGTSQTESGRKSSKANGLSGKRDPRFHGLDEKDYTDGAF